MSRDDPLLISLAFTFRGYASYTNLKKIGVYAPIRCKTVSLILKDILTTRNLSYINFFK